MADTVATLGFGAILKNYASNTHASAAAIAHTMDIKGPSMSRGVIDITNNDSSNNMREKLAGLIDGGQVECSVIYTYTQATALYTLFKAAAPSFWWIDYPDGSIWALGRGFISDFGTEAPTDDDKMTNTITIEIAGGAVAPGLSSSSS